MLHGIRHPRHRRKMEYVFWSVFRKNTLEKFQVAHRSFIKHGGVIYAVAAASRKIVDADDFRFRKLLFEFGYEI